VKHSFNFYKLWLSVGVGLFATITYLSLTSRPLDIVSFAMSDKVGHVIAYFSLMTWFGQIYVTKTQHFILAIGFSVMGAGLEGLQYIGGHRMFEYNDMMANMLGVGIGWWFTRYAISGVLLKMDMSLAKIIKLQ